MYTLLFIAFELNADNDEALDRQERIVMRAYWHSVLIFRASHPLFLVLDPPRGGILSTQRFSAFTRLAAFSSSCRKTTAGLPNPLFCMVQASGHDVFWSRRAPIVIFSCRNHHREL